MQAGKDVMVRSTLGQPVVRTLLAERNGRVIVCRREALDEWHQQGAKPTGVEVAREDVFELDQQLLEAMKAFDEVLDSKPAGLARLWEKAKPLR